ncbi:tetratricopeptide repeat protein [Candidatus Babeliales bacterium]|nr:tetratricopeptide repeat protein [Candidatus Babeliales bacterium]
MGNLTLNEPSSLEEGNAKGNKGFEEKVPFWHFVVPPFLLTFITTVFYYPSLNYPFQFDDIANITKNFQIRFLNPGYRLFKNRWLGELLNRLNYQIGKFDPFYYRSCNLIIHLLSGIVLFYLILSICRGLDKKTFLFKNSVLASFVTTALFLLHPAQTQTISYVIQARLEGLAGFFIILSVLIFVKLAQSNQTLTKIILAILLAISGFLSCGTKEIALIGPVLLIVTDWFLVSQQKWTIFKKHIWIHLMFSIIVFGTFGYHVSLKWYTDIFGLKMETANNRGNVLTQNANDIIKPYDYFISEFKVILHYLLIFLWPFILSVEYDWKLANGFFSPDAFFPFLILVAIAAFLIRNIVKKEYPYLTFGLIWFFISVAPRSTIVPSPELICDYKTYIPSVGWLFAIGIGMTYLINLLATQLKNVKNKIIQNLFSSILVLSAISYLTGISILIWKVEDHLKAPAITLLFIPAGIIYALFYVNKNRQKEFIYSQRNLIIFSLMFLLPIGYGTLNRNIVWSTSEEFWGDIVKKAPLKARGHNNYGVALSEKGNYHEAIKHYKEALKLDTHYCDPYSNLAVAYSLTGKTNQAIAALKQALRIFPNYPEAYNNLGSFLLQKKDYDGAEHCFRLAIRLRPWYGKAHMNLGRLFLERKENEKGWECFVNATHGDLDNEMGFAALGEAAIRLKKYSEAIKAFEQAVKLSKSPSPRIFFSLANSYYMEKQYDKSLGIYQHLTKVDPQNAHYLYNMGETLLAIKDYSAALNTFKKAKDLPNAIPQTYLRLANCLELTGNIDSAIKYLKVLKNAEAPDWFKETTEKELARLENPGKAQSQTTSAS